MNKKEIATIYEQIAGVYRFFSSAGRTMVIGLNPEEVKRDIKIKRNLWSAMELLDKYIAPEVRKKITSKIVKVCLRETKKKLTLKHPDKSGQ